MKAVICMAAAACVATIMRGTVAETAANIDAPAPPAGAFRSHPLRQRSPMGKTGPGRMSSRSAIVVCASTTRPPS